MIKATHAKWAHVLFAPYLKRLFRKHFFALQWPQILPQVDNSKSVLLLANHFSWWDGFFWYFANERLFRKKFHVLMLEDQLSKFWFFKYLGAFSVRKNSRDVIESLHYAAELLQDPENMVLIFPQGSIQVPWISTPEMGKGAEYIWKKSHSHTNLYFGAVLTHYGSQPKPTATFFIQQATEVAPFADYYSQLLRETEKSWTD